MSAPTGEAVRAVVEQVLGGAYFGMAQDVRMLRAAAVDEGESQAVREAYEAQADAAFDELVDAVAAEVEAARRAKFTVNARHVRRGAIDYVLITVSGHLDEQTAPQVREAIKTARTPAGYPSIAIDLTHATVHGRKGLSPLVNAFFSARWKAETEFYLISGSKMERRVLSQIAGGSLRAFSSAAELDAALDAEPQAVNA